MSANPSFRPLGALLATCAVAVGAFASACSSSNSNPQPPPVYTVGSDASTIADATADGQPDAPTDSPPPDAESPPDAGDGSPDALAAPDAPFEDAAACTADSGCWSCTPTTEPQFLNQCTSSTCVPFDNLSRLPGYDGGALPPLQ